VLDSVQHVILRHIAMEWVGQAVHRDYCCQQQGCPSASPRTSNACPRNPFCVPPPCMGGAAVDLDTGVQVGLLECLPLNKSLAQYPKNEQS
jgi:hypothetical protein